jgi:WD40 repeat protein
MNNQEPETEDKSLKNPVLKLNNIYKGHKDIVNSVSLHPTEPVFATGSGDSTIRLYDYELKD